MVHVAHPAELAGGGLYVASCSCGWVSVTVVTAAGAHAHGLAHVHAHVGLTHAPPCAEPRGSAPARCVDPQETNVPVRQRGTEALRASLPTRFGTEIHDTEAGR